MSATDMEVVPNLLLEVVYVLWPIHQDIENLERINQCLCLSGWIGIFPAMVCQAANVVAFIECQHDKNILYYSISTIVQLIAKPCRI